MEQYGSSVSFNLESVLHQNIKNADYYRNNCIPLKTWSEVVDAIYEEVDYVEPWLAGNARGPSTAFCLLHQLFTLKPTEDEIHETITHQDSVYIRAIGFLYLRYVCNPKQLWQWMGQFCDDGQEIQPSGPNGPTVTVGDFVRDLLLEQYYFETLFPRIPKKVEEDIQGNLRARGLPAKGKGNGGCGGPDRRGGDDGGAKRPASVKASLSVAFGQRAPNRAGTKDARWKDVSAAAVAGGGGGGGSRAGGSRSRSRSREVPRRNGAAGGTPERRDKRDYDRSDRRDYDRSDKRDYDRSGRSYEGGYDGRDRRREDYDSRRRDYGSRDNYDGDGSRGAAGREQAPSSERDRGYSSRDRGLDSRDRGYGSRGDRGGRDRREEYDRDRQRDRYSRRSRSRSPVRQPGRDARDVFKERAGDAAAAADIRGRYGDASGKLDLGSSGTSMKRSADEVFRIGGRGYR